MNDFHFLRSGYSYKKISHDKIIKITLTKGSATKYPKRTFIFGIVLILASSAFFTRVFSIEKFLHFENLAFKVAWAFVVIAGFLLAVGIASVILVLRKTTILKVEANDGTNEVFSLNELIKLNQLEELKQSAEQLFKNRLIIEIN
ncbi:hypothetical protein [Ekhidna sp. MALMAid0563]|uniref:hypothetical protein n=1 Tax=Ekhidna sp. MALMAid0563 TaxID=3143937 RepID=UPI0032DF2A5C